MLLIVSSTASRYNREVVQLLNHETAAHVAIALQGQPIEATSSGYIDSLFSAVMVYHPAIEIYLLNKSGHVLAYSAPDSVISSHQVDLGPVRHFLSSDKTVPIEGTNPRQPKRASVFSAAEWRVDGQLEGYVYVVLMGAKFIESSNRQLSKHVTWFSVKMVGILLLLSVAIGYFFYRYLHLNLSRTADAVERFRQGDLDTRLDTAKVGDWRVLSTTFNDMAQTIQGNIHRIHEMSMRQRDLILNIAHDLKTPLTSIRGFAETIALEASSDDRPTVHKHTGVILKNCQQLMLLVDHLYDYAHLQATNPSVSIEPFSIAELLLDNKDKYELIAAKLSVSVRVDMPANLPLVLGDVGLIDRVFQNLVDNALKFCGEGDTITIGARLKEDVVGMYVSDTGPGIPQDLRSSVFNRFEKHEQVLNHSTSGLGLGLDIVVKILELHDTTIMLSSSDGEGATFSFDLPRY